MARTNFGAVDVLTALPTVWNPVGVLFGNDVMRAFGTELYLGGRFDYIGGELRSFNARFPFTGPTTVAAAPGGFYNSGCVQTLYTTDDSDPLTSGTAQVYAAPIAVAANLTLRFASSDVATNVEPVQSEQYVFDGTAPVTAAVPAAGQYDDPQQVTLTCSDDKSGCTDTRFTSDGSDPQTSATAQVYGGAIAVGADTTLRYFSTDAAGNAEATVSASYDIGRPDPRSSSSVFGVLAICGLVTALLRRRRWPANVGMTSASSRL